MLNNAADYTTEIIWLAGPDINDQLTLISNTITHTLMSGKQFSDYDELVFVMCANNKANAPVDMLDVRNPDRPIVFPLHIGVEAFQSADAQEMGGCTWMQLGPDEEYRDSHRPNIEPEIGPRPLVTQIGCEGDNKFKFRFTPDGYGLLRILGVREAA